MDGIILVNKEKDWTSFDVVAKIRNTLKTKVGHTGTLDPMATGLLVILLGSACKLEKYLVVKDKKYTVEMEFGIKTDTGDLSGKVISKEEYQLDNYSKDELIEILNTFIGKQTQIPPKYSALKHEGQSLHRLAREQILSDEEIESVLESKKREIEIYSIEVLEILPEENILKLEISCSSGTYIRTLVEDIAKIAFNTIATVKSLDRTSLGKFDIKDSYSISEIIENSKDKILSIEDTFNHFPKTRIAKQRVYYFENGVRITNNNPDGLYRVYSFEEENKDNEIEDKFVGLGFNKNNLMKREYIYED